MIYIDLDADLNMEDDDGRNFARITPPTAPPAVGDVLVAGNVAYFHQVAARQATQLATLVSDMPQAL